MRQRVNTTNNLSAYSFSGLTAGKVGDGGWGRAGSDSELRVQEEPQGTRRGKRGHLATA